MHINTTNNILTIDSLAKVTCWLLFASVMFKWVTTETIFSFSILSYLFFIVPLGLFIILLFNNTKFILVDAATKVWIPWLCYILVQTVLNSNWERFSYHFICLLLLLSSINISITNSFPKKLALFIGIFSLIGIAVELLFPSFYYAVINPLFISSSFGDYGLRGFTYQLDVSAAFIMLFEMVWLYFYKDKVKPIIFWTFLFLSILAIFLSGKRMHSALSITIPILVYLIVAQKRQKSTIITLIFLIGIGYSIGTYFINNASNFEDDIFLHRFANTVELAQGNEDITSSRYELTELALNLWKANPLLGIGDLTFQSYTNRETAVHNAYLQTLCEQGVFGFVLWIIPIIYCFILSCRIIKRLDLDVTQMQWMKVSLFCQIQFILYGLTGNPTVNEDRYVLYFFSIAILSEIHYHINTENCKSRINNEHMHL